MICHRPLGKQHAKEEAKIDHLGDFLAQTFTGKFYYTIRELSNRCAEIWALLSLQTEVYLDLGSPWDIPQAGYDHAWDAHGGDTWLHQHVIRNYTDCWQNRLANGEMDGSMCDIGTSRWFNYYLEGLYWSVRNAPHIEGVYYDGINFDRKSMRRIRKTIEAAAKEAGLSVPLLDFHTGQVAANPSAVSYLSHFPYADSAWNGEGFGPNFASGPTGWLVGFSSFIFGIASDRLDYGTSKNNDYKGMLYGAYHRNNALSYSLWKLWDAVEIEKMTMIGWWEDDAAVTATSTLIPPPAPAPPPVPSPPSAWKRYPHMVFGADCPNVTPCLCRLPTVNDGHLCKCSLCCPAGGHSILNVTLAQCEAGCLGQAVVTNHKSGVSCTGINYSPSSMGCVYRGGPPKTMPATPNAQNDAYTYTGPPITGGVRGGGSGAGKEVVPVSTIASGCADERKADPAAAGSGGGDPSSESAL